MKFTVSSQELSTALQIVNMARKGKTPMQILECVLIEAQENKIVLTGTDMSMQVSYSIPCDVDECGKSAIRGTLIEEVVKKFPDGMLAVDVNEKDAFTVKSGRIKSRLSGNKSDEFPVKEPMDASKTVTIPANDFCDMIASTEMCIAVEDVRQVLNGGCLDVSSGAVSMVGMDGFRMAVRTIKPSSVPDDMRVIIPIKTLGVLKKMLSNAGDELIDLRFTDKDFGLSFGNAEVLCTLIEGQYVEYSKIVPQQFGTVVTLDARQFRDTVERAAMIARLGENRLVRLAVRGDSMTVYASSGVDEIAEVVDAMTSGADAEIAFNVKYLLDAVKMFTSGEVLLKMNNSISPCIVNSADDDGSYYMLILPVRTSATIPTTQENESNE